MTYALVDHDLKTRTETKQHAGARAHPPTHILHWYIMQKLNVVNVQMSSVLKHDPCSFDVRKEDTGFHGVLTGNHRLKQSNEIIKTYLHDGITCCTPYWRDYMLYTLLTGLHAVHPTDGITCCTPYWRDYMLYTQLSGSALTQHHDRRAMRILGEYSSRRIIQPINHCRTMQEPGCFCYTSRITDSQSDRRNESDNLYRLSIYKLVIS